MRQFLWFYMQVMTNESETGERLRQSIRQKVSVDAVLGPEASFPGKTQGCIGHRAAALSLRRQTPEAELEADFRPRASDRGFQHHSPTKRAWSSAALHKDSGEKARRPMLRAAPESFKGPTTTPASLTSPDCAAGPHPNLFSPSCSKRTAAGALFQGLAAAAPWLAERR